MVFYKLWGRSMYDPTITDDTFKKEFTRRYGSAGEQLLTLLH
jgi:hypothetical protein